MVKEKEGREKKGKKAPLRTLKEKRAEKDANRAKNSAG
jgi:hypothetical protein